MPDILEVDVLIIGGGIMGLWLANDLQARGYQYALLERHELGGDQTCHSHVYLHQGFIYNDREISLAGRLRIVTERWQTWLQDRSHLLRSEISYFGFRDEAEFAAKRALWQDPALGLTFQEVPPASWPAALEASPQWRSQVRILVSTPERCLDGSLLVKELQSPVARDRTFRICRMEQIRIGPDGIESIARMERDQMLRLRSSFLIFTAGGGNLPLMAEMFPEMVFEARPNDEVRSPQQIRKAHMLVIRGAKDDLPPLNGVFRSFNGLFIVSRELADGNVWLVSDHRSPVIQRNEDWITYDRRWWLPAVIANLNDLSPAVLARANRLQWGIYDAPKAEGTARGKLPEEERIIHVSRNTWAVWPTKLTLAPRASDVLLARMNLAGVKPGVGLSLPGCSSVWSAFERPGVAQEKWVTTSMVCWDQFRRDSGDATGVIYGNQ